MFRAAEYKNRAHECREQAKLMLRPEDSAALERVAQLWEKLAYVCERAPEAKEQPCSSHSEKRRAALRTDGVTPALEPSISE
jgi:hypothetical protein